jgi:hypothetical protein
MFVEFKLQEIFSSALERGPVRREEEGLLRDIMIIDEAHLFFRDDENNILNTIAKEGRKFGLGLICASQSPTHFSEDFFFKRCHKDHLGRRSNVLGQLSKKNEGGIKIHAIHQAISSHRSTDE